MVEFMLAHERGLGVNLANRSPIGYRASAATLGARDASALQVLRSVGENEQEEELPRKARKCSMRCRGNNHRLAPAPGRLLCIEMLTACIEIVPDLEARDYVFHL